MEKSIRHVFLMLWVHMKETIFLFFSKIRALLLLLIWKCLSFSVYCAPCVCYCKIDVFFFFFWQKVSVWQGEVQKWVSFDAAKLERIQSRVFFYLKLDLSSYLSPQSSVSSMEKLLEDDHPQKKQLNWARRFSAAAGRSGSTGSSSSSAFTARPDELLACRARLRSRRRMHTIIQHRQELPGIMFAEFLKA